MVITGLHVSLFLYALVVLALLVAEVREDRRAQFFFKPLAAFGFVIMALQFGALESNYGKIVFAGLIACAVGDIFLLSRKSEDLFRAGMAAFALGHILYAVAFGLQFEGIEIDGYIVISLTGVSAAVFFMWLRPYLGKGMIGPTLIYTIVISLMVAASVGRFNYYLKYAVPLGAILFAISDMFVAKDRFVKPNSKNAIIITPLYFTAQALFAFSVWLEAPAI